MGFGFWGKFFIWLGWVVIILFALPVLLFSTLSGELGLGGLPKLIGILLLALGGFFIWLGYKRKYRHHHEHREPRHNKSRFVRKYLVWFIAFTIGILIAYLIKINYMPNLKLIFWIILSGVFIEICSKIMQVLVFDHKWKLDLHFIFWIVVQILLFFISYNLTNLIHIEIVYVNLILIGFVQTILVHFVWKLNIEGKLFK